MTELLSLWIVSNETSGLVGGRRGVGGGGVEVRGLDQALALPCTNPCVENLLSAFSRGGRLQTPFSSSFVFIDPSVPFEVCLKSQSQL